ncbi:MAG: tetratricopeptide repeat protein [Desulfobacterales bacterium]
MLPRTETDTAAWVRIFSRFFRWIFSPAHCTALVLAVCFLAAAFAQTAESSELEFTPEAVYEFANRNYETGDFLEAAIEFKRFVHFFPVHPLAAEAGYKAGMAYFQIPRYSKAMNQFEKVAGRFSKTDYALEAMFMISRCHAGMNNMQEAIHTLDTLAARAAGQNDRDRALYKSGLLRLESGDISGAGAAFGEISKENRGKYNIGQILSDLDDPDRFELKNPVLAGIFSVVPGGGYLYTGRYQDAVTAFFLTSALAAVSWEAFDQDLYALGGLAGLTGAGFYAGGALGAVSSTHKYNKKVYRDYSRQLQEERGKKPGFSIGIGQDSVMVSFAWCF